MTKNRIGVLALLAALVFSGFALAGSPARSQYGNPTENERPPSVTPRLPFTGFQAGMVLLAGIGALTAGVMLRSGALEKRGPSLLAPARGDTDRELAFLAAPLQHCETCGKPLASMGFRVLRSGRTYDSVECARGQRPPGASLAYTFRA